MKITKKRKSQFKVLYEKDKDIQHKQGADNDGDGIIVINEKQYPSLYQAVKKRNNTKDLITGKIKNNGKSNFTVIKINLNDEFCITQNKIASLDEFLSQYGTSAMRPA